MTPPPGDPADRLAAHRAARRAAIKQHHPDRGGSSDELRRALDRLDASLGRTSQITPIRPDARSEARVDGVLRTAIHRLRRLLPRRLPGSRRYIQL
ncbi:hypothetical protein AERO_13940 [Aeromicrobium fastidiosum]|uniref:hypothetical protein n=1 Tax=Aeromicrobium fastidiosum TaxID=52699 RepID=UPI0020232AE7|nr:hypothetical protein [Aeromicrobium fastidiosum]MCL8252488.1 hypothetical protein [Aeromicrobium fastidiosum]